MTSTPTTKQTISHVDPRPAMLRRTRFRFAFSMWIAMLASVVMTAGCGNAPRGIPRGNISGKVTMQDAPVTEGIVTFFSRDTGIAAGVELDDQGLFRIPDGIEIGSYVVTITPSYGDEPPGLTPTEPVAHKHDKIPARYRTGETTELSATVEKGTNYYEFRMLN